MRVTLDRTNERYTMQAKNENGNTILFDNSAAGGGDDAGFRPMQSLLAAAGACSSIDVISILKKQRYDNFGLSVTIDGERDTGKDANLWVKVHLHFTVTGDVPADKVARAVELSVTKYCSVSKTLEAAGAVVTATSDVRP